MNKNLLLDKMKYLVQFLVASQGILFALLAIFFLGRNYSENWVNYNVTPDTERVYLQDLSDEVQTKVFQYFSSAKRSF